MAAWDLDFPREPIFVSARLMRSGAVRSASVTPARSVGACTGRWGGQAEKVSGRKDARNRFLTIVPQGIPDSPVNGS